MGALPFDMGQQLGALEVCPAIQRLLGLSMLFKQDLLSDLPLAAFISPGLAGPLCRTVTHFKSALNGGCSHFLSFAVFCPSSGRQQVL